MSNFISLYFYLTIFSSTDSINFSSVNLFIIMFKPREEIYICYHFIH